MTDTTQYCWQFLHPTLGWVGGTSEDNWTDKKAVVERNASLCDWPTKIISRPKQALLGSVRPSIRGTT